MSRTTTPRRPLTFGLAAAVLGLGLALSGCMGAEPEPPTTDGPPASSAPADPSTAPSTDTSSAPSTEPSADAPGEDGSAGSEEGTDSGSDGEKPSQEDVAAGLAGSIGELVPLPDGSDEILTQLTSCAVETIYDDASAESLQAMADGQLAEADADDLNALSTAIEECSTEVTG